MKNNVPRCIVLVVLCCLASPVTFAHHGNSAYDEKNPVVLKGVVTEYVFANPHAQIYFDVKNDQANIVHWACETLGPTILSMLGWTRKTLKPGDEITVTLDPAKSGNPVGYLRKIVLAGGTILPLRTIQ
jgi:hypothetical protein